MINDKIIWLTGQPGSGKTTLANELKNRIEKNSKDVMIVDGDDLRNITTNKDYSRKGEKTILGQLKKLQNSCLIKIFYNCFVGCTV